MERRDILKIIFQRLWVFPLMLMMTIGGAILYLAIQTPTYQSEMRFFVAGLPKVSSAYYEQSSSVLDANAAMTTSELLKSRDLAKEIVLMLELSGRDTDAFDSHIKRTLSGVLDKALNRVNDAKDWFMRVAFNEEPSEPAKKDPIEQAVDRLVSNIAVTPIEKTDVIKVTIKDVDPVMSQKIGESLARLFFLGRIRSQLADLRTQYGNAHPLVEPLLATAVANLQVPLPDDERTTLKTLMSFNSVKLVQYPFVPQKPVSPQRKWVLLGAVASGVLGALFIVFFLAQTDPLIRNSEEINTLYNLPLLGTIPRQAWGVPLFARQWWRPQDIDPRAFVPLAYQIQAARLETGINRLFVATADDSKSNRALVNILAYGLSRTLPKDHGAPRRSLVVVETEQEGRLFIQNRKKVAADANTKSLVDYFQGSGDIKDVIHPIDESLSIVTLRKNGESALVPFDPDKCRAFMDTMASMFDLVLVRAPQFSKRSEFAFFHSLCQGSVIIAGEQTTRKKVLGTMVADMKKKQAPILGVVLNNQSFSLPKILYSLT
jgi:capsular polysaccharide biosynthesis protein